MAGNTNYSDLMQDSTADFTEPVTSLSSAFMDPWDPFDGMFEMQMQNLGKFEDNTIEADPKTYKEVISELFDASAELSRRMRNETYLEEVAYLAHPISMLAPRRRQTITQTLCNGTHGAAQLPIDAQNQVWIGTHRRACQAFGMAAKHEAQAQELQTGRYYHATRVRWGAQKKKQYCEMRESSQKKKEARRGLSLRQQHLFGHSSGRQDKSYSLESTPNINASLSRYSKRTDLRQSTGSTHHTSRQAQTESSTSTAVSEAKKYSGSTRPEANSYLDRPVTLGWNEDDSGTVALLEKQSRGVSYSNVAWRMHKASNHAMEIHRNQDHLCTPVVLFNSMSLISESTGKRMAETNMRVRGMSHYHLTVAYCNLYPFTEA
eukprot:IDg11325t1